MTSLGGCHTEPRGAHTENAYVRTSCNRFSSTTPRLTLENKGLQMHLIDYFPLWAYFRTVIYQNVFESAPILAPASKLHDWLYRVQARVYAARPLIPPRQSSARTHSVSVGRLIHKSRQAFRLLLVIVLARVDGLIGFPLKINSSPSILA